MTRQAADRRAASHRRQTRHVAGDLRSRRRRASWQWALDARVTHRALALKTALAEAGALYLPERLHVVRIALKKLRYACEVAPRRRGQYQSRTRSLKRGQDILGRLHDVQVLLDRIRQVQARLRRAIGHVPPAGFAGRSASRTNAAACMRVSCTRRRPSSPSAIAAPAGNRALATAARRADRISCAMCTSSI